MRVTAISQDVQSIFVFFSRALRLLVRFWRWVLPLSLFFCMLLLIGVSLISSLLPSFRIEVSWVIFSPFLVGYLKFLELLRNRKIPRFRVFFDGWQEPLLFPALGASILLAMFLFLLHSLFRFFLPVGATAGMEWMTNFFALLVCALLALEIYPLLARQHLHIWKIWTVAWYSLSHHWFRGIALLSISLFLLFLSIRIFVLFPFILPLLSTAILENSEA